MFLAVGMAVVGSTSVYHFRSVGSATAALTFGFCWDQEMAESLYSVSYSSARPMAVWPNSCETISAAGRPVPPPPRSRCGVTPRPVPMPGGQAESGTYSSRTASSSMSEADPGSTSQCCGTQHNRGRLTTRCSCRGSVQCVSLRDGRVAERETVGWSRWLLFILSAHVSICARHVRVVERASRGVRFGKALA